MKYLDLFAGYGGFSLGIQQAYEKKLCNANRSKNGGSKKGSPGNQREGLQSSEGQETCTKKGSASKRNNNLSDERPLCVGFSEIDKYAIQVYQKHFNHKNYGDITKIDPTTIPDFDLLTGGFPCQSFSIAGKRGGFNDTRGTLFFDIARILKEKQPKHFLLENVKGLLSHDSGRTFKTIIATLTELGYCVEWQVLNAKNFGVPQNRERVFIVGHLGKIPRQKVFPIGEANEKDTRNVGEDLSYCLDATYSKGCNNTLAKGRRQLIQLNKPTHSNDRVYSDQGISPTLNTMQGGRRQPFIVDDTQGFDGVRKYQKEALTLRSGRSGLKVCIPEATKKGYAEAKVGDSINLSVPNSTTPRGRVGNKIAQTLDTGMQQHTLTENAQIRRLTPLECERLMGLPDNWTKYGNDHDWTKIKISDTQRYKLCGNGVVVNVVEEIIKRLL